MLPAISVDFIVLSKPEVNLLQLSEKFLTAVFNIAIQTKLGGNLGTDVVTFMFLNMY